MSQKDLGTVQGGNVVDSRMERRRAERRIINRKMGVAGIIIAAYVTFQLGFAILLHIGPF